ncbi:Jerky protein [Plakobranchus ocellatus]|uniref:Jerky protein n=1 Tax=Plakobranchus ocellatus TaxID=259542 RepID=A0AAV4CKY4_9GAST|nr:Jerky protein [Plakobranchus ocellatus]
MQAISIGSDNKRQITILGCASASGKRLPPLVIFPGKLWTFRPEEDFPGAVCKQTDNSWVNFEVFRSWLLETLVPHVQCEEEPGTSAAEDPPVKDTLCSTPSNPDDQCQITSNVNASRTDDHPYHRIARKTK